MLSYHSISLLSFQGRIVLAIIALASVGYIVNVSTEIVRYSDTQWLSEAEWPSKDRVLSKQKYDDDTGKIVFAITSPVSTLSRRDIIRSTWISHLKMLNYGDDLVKTFFYMSSPGKDLLPAIDSEQAAYNDLFIIRSLKIDSKSVATTVKSTEMYTQFIKDKTVPLDEIRWFCKVDDDSFLVVKPLMERYLFNSSITPERTLIGRTLTKTKDDGSEFIYPGGQFYCITPDLIHVLSEGPPKINPKYALDGTAGGNEDVPVGEVLFKFHEHFTMIDLPNNIAHDVPPGVVGEDDVDAWIHSPTEQSINPHKMKTDEDYLKVASMYDENGWISKK